MGVWEYGSMGVLVGDYETYTLHSSTLSTLVLVVSQRFG